MHLGSDEFWDGSSTLLLLVSIVGLREWTKLKNILHSHVSHDKLLK